MRKLNRFWSVIVTGSPRHADVAAFWREALGEEFAAISPLLHANGKIASSYPCPVRWGCSCRHEVVHIRGDLFAAVPDDNCAARCEVANLRREDVVVQQLDVAAVWDGVAAALDIAVLPNPASSEECFHLGNVGRGRSPCAVYAVVVKEAHEMLRVIQRLALETEEPFVILCPTGRFYGPECDRLMRRRKALFLPLNENIGMGAEEGQFIAAPGALDLLDAMRATEPGALRQYVFRRVGDYWDLVFEGKPAHLQHTKGLATMHCLMRSSGMDLHVAQVLAEVAGQETAPLVGNAGEILSPEAIADYKERVLDLKERIRDAERNNDIGAKAAAEKELNELTVVLAGAFGLHNRVRTASDDVERIRKALWSNVNRTLGKLKKAHPPLWQHLSRSLKTGIFMTYAPSSPIDWQF